MLPWRPVLVRILMAILAHRPLASRETVFKELPLLILATHLWNHQCYSLLVQFLCDHRGVPDTIAIGFCSDGELGDLLRSLFFAAARRYFLISAMHVPGRPNSIADALSRSPGERCRTLARLSPLASSASARGT